MSSLRFQWNYLKTHEAFKSKPVQTLLRLFIWKVICIFKMKSTQVEFSEWGFTMLLPPEWRGVAKLLYAFREWYEPELAVLGRFLKAGDVGIDVGSNYGVYSLRASCLVGAQGQVLAFEPAAKAFDCLQANISANNAKNISAFPYALSNQTGGALLYHDADSSRNSLAGANEGRESESVLVRTLDEILKEWNVSRVDFIKIDTEGADELVCRGAVRTIEAFHPVIMFEINPDAANQLELESDGAAVFLGNLGYHFYKISTTDFRLEELSELPSVDNVLAIFRGEDK